MTDPIQEDAVAIDSAAPADSRATLEPKPKSTEEKAAMLDGARSAKKRLEAATQALEAARQAEKAALIEQARALEEFKASKKSLDKEIEGTP